jgi:hypothetical protein
MPMGFVAAGTPIEATAHLPENPLDGMLVKESARDFMRLRASRPQIFIGFGVDGL